MLTRRDVVLLVELFERILQVRETAIRSGPSYDYAQAREDAIGEVLHGAARAARAQSQCPSGRRKY
jgi:hypothetical protein